MDVKEYKMELEIVREMHYNEESLFGIYACRPVHFTEEIEMNKYNNFSIKGQTRKLAVGESYVIEFDGPHANPNPRFDDNYNIVEVEPERLDSVEDQDRFLQSIISEGQFNSLKEAYPDPNLLVDLILEDKINTSKTKGIKKKSLSKIKFKVEQNAHISILIAKLNILNLSAKAIDKLLVHFKTSQAVIEAIEENIYNLCSVKQFGFILVDQSALGRGDDPTNENRITACITYLLKQDNQSGHTWTYRGELLEEAEKLLQIDLNIIIDQLDSLGKSKKIYIEESKIALPHIRKQEIEVRRHLWRIHSAYVAPSRVRVESKIQQVEEDQGFEFTKEQKNAIIESSQDGVSIINGGGGVGKTTIVKGLIRTLGNENYMATTLSGKATNVLSKTGVNASTIHRMLKFDGKEFAFNEIKPLPYEIIIIDEASMVSVSLFLSVLRAIKSGSKVLIVGDSGQLPAIGFGDFLFDLLSSKAFPIYELTQVHRQVAKSGILNLASEVRKGNQVTSYNSSGRETYGELEDQVVIRYSKEDKDNISYDILKIAKSYKEKIVKPEDLLDFQILVTNREGALGVMRMNTELQKIFNDINKPFLSRSGYDYREDDKVIAIGNTYKLVSYSNVDEYLQLSKEASLLDEDEREEVVGNIDVFNGTSGIIKKIHTDSKMTFIQFEGIDGLIAYNQAALEKISLAYVITVHRAQGSGIRHTILAFDYSAYKLLTRQLVYTGITRASEKGLILAENNALYTAIQNDANTRRTFLKDLLIDSMNIR